MTFLPHLLNLMGIRAIRAQVSFAPVTQAAPDRKALARQLRDAVLQRLAAAGHSVHHPGGPHPHRRSVYFAPDALLMIEFVQYLSADPELRNAYG